MPSPLEADKTKEEENKTSSDSKSALTTASRFQLQSDPVPNLKAKPTDTFEKGALSSERMMGPGLHSDVAVSPPTQKIDTDNDRNSSQGDGNLTSNFLRGANPIGEVRPPPKRTSSLRKATESV